ncbi:MAG: hypothetical protein BM556_05765 [Bacteriovorax sp. MedPE-SWde]|nr:MAG: hypothetical protein BM556_05765 [Bacteriovorax sp. MedPE-SWde]
MKKLYLAKIFHKRCNPRANEFSYNGFYISFDIDKAESMNSLLFGVNRRRIFSFKNCDHGFRNSKSLRSWANHILNLSGVSDFKGQIVLQTFPRVFGMVFNPVSFWFCYEGNKCKYIISEVNNTFGETHAYLIETNDDTKSGTLPKKFHVSPFFDIQGEYNFDFSEKNTAEIKLFNDEELQIITNIKGNEIEWSLLNFIKLVIKYPLYSLLIQFLIHYQALKLYLMKNKFYSKPTKTRSEVTYEY